MYSLIQSVYAASGGESDPKRLKKAEKKKHAKNLISNHEDHEFFLKTIRQ